MSNVARRDVGPFLRFIRHLLLRGSSPKQYLRWREDLASRSYPSPHLIEGSASAISDNRYFERDSRRANLPPLNIKNIKQISSGNEDKISPSTSKLPTPGAAYFPFCKEVE